jgi:hypothetical protein
MKEQRRMVITKREDLHMLDGRIYETEDNWQTVWLLRDGKRSKVTGRDADLVRFLAVAQSSAGP